MGGCGGMPIDIDSSLAAIGRGLEVVPRVILAPLLLAGPTLLWLLYRFHVRPDAAKRSPQAIHLALWECGSCTSLTPVGQSICYRCHSERPSRVIELEHDDRGPRIVSITPIVSPGMQDSDGVGIPVGPGRPIAVPAARLGAPLPPGTSAPPASTDLAWSVGERLPPPPLPAGNRRSAQGTRPMSAKSASPSRSSRTTSAKGRRRSSDA
jgi:hypothetical protein